MNLAKWLMINKSIRQIGGPNNRFVLPVTTPSHADMKTVLYPRLLEKDLGHGAREVQSENASGTDRRRSITADFNYHAALGFQNPKEINNHDRVHTNKCGLVQTPPAQEQFITLTRNTADSQMTLDEWICRDNSFPEGRQKSSVSARAQVGRWALKRGFQQIPKPPPIQTEFKLKSIEVVRNELDYSDIEIIAKPVKGRFARFLTNICSLIKKVTETMFKKLSAG